MTYKEAIDVLQVQLLTRYHADLAPFQSREDLFKMDSAVELAISALKEKLANQR